jgi:hypothetical protein
MAHLAMSMTNYVRLNPALTDEKGNPTSPWHRSQYVGVPWTTQSYFHVRWAWIVLPVVVMVTACLYLWAAALENWVSLWKGSLLPVIFFPLADGTRGNFSVFSTTHEMQEYAQATRGSLQCEFGEHKATDSSPVTDAVVSIKIDSKIIAPRMVSILQRMQPCTLCPYIHGPK